MDCRLTLIEIYLFICKRSDRLEALAQRQSNNRSPAFTDAEVLTVYLFGLVQKRRSVRETYDYAADHFGEWFPLRDFFDLPSYQSYNRRLNRMSAVFAPLAESALSQIDCSCIQQEAVRIADSMPIMLAKEKRSSQAKVAPQLADKGYCSSKGTFFYGVKLHAVAQRRPGALPVPSRVGLTPGSENDLTALRRVLPDIEGGELYGDKAYSDGPMKERLYERASLRRTTPRRAHAGQAKERPKAPLGSQQAVLDRRQQSSPTHRVALQLDQREDRHSARFEGALPPRTARARLRTARRCNAIALIQPLIRIFIIVRRRRSAFLCSLSGRFNQA